MLYINTAHIYDILACVCMHIVLKAATPVCLLNPPYTFFANNAVSTNNKYYGHIVPLV